MSSFMTGRALILASLAFACKAAYEPAKLSSFGTICGDARIFELFAKDDSVEAARNVKFTEIKSLMGSRRDLFQADIDKETANIKQIEGEIAKLKGRGKPQPMDQEATDAFINQAIKVADAKKNGCGFDGGESFETITVNFAKAAPAYFQEPKILNEPLFIQRIQAEVGTEGDCDFLADELLPIAREASAKSYKPADDSAWQDKKIKAVKKRIEIEEKITQCQDAQKSLEAFETAMKQRTTQEQAKGDDFRKTKRELNDAFDDLDDLDEEAETLKEALDGALEKLKGDDKAVKDAKSSLETCKKGEAEIKDHLFKVTVEFEKVSKKLHRFTKANAVVEELRDAVSMTTKKMWLLFEQAALQPIKNQGLSGDTLVQKYFHKTLADIPTGAELSQSVTTLTDFCKNEAMPAFKQVKGVNLAPLCATGDATAIMTGIRKSMDARREDVQLLLAKLQTWFDPLKGQSEITPEEVVKRQKAGEPEGLREIMTTYSRSTYYKGYLENWTVKGKFLLLISQLTKTVEALSKTYGELLLRVKVLPQMLAKASKDRAEAEQKLKEAMKALQASDAEKEALEASVKSQEEKIVKMTQQVTDLEDKLKKALAAWEAAKKTLVETYKAGLAFIEEEEQEEIAGPGALLEQA